MKVYVFFVIAFTIIQSLVPLLKAEYYEPCLVTRTRVSRDLDGVVAGGAAISGSDSWVRSRRKTNHRKGSHTHTRTLTHALSTGYIIDAIA